jgi:hypothetical protein
LGISSDYFWLSSTLTRLPNKRFLNIQSCTAAASKPLGISMSYSVSRMNKFISPTSAYGKIT